VSHISTPVWAALNRVELCSKPLLGWHPNCSKAVVMPHGTVVLAGRLPVEHLKLHLLAAEFGWSIKQASSLCGVAELNADRNPVAVLFNPRDLALPWESALRGVLEAAPGALPILCHGFAETIDWPRAAEAGAFHSLHIPFALSEVRRSLGFVWEAKRRSVVIPINPRAAAQEQGQRDRAWAAGSVA
jgi:hypothetical protein